MYAKIKAFENKLGLWKLQFISNNLAYVQPLRTEKPTGAKKCAEEIPILQQELCFRIRDFGKHAVAFRLFSVQFDINVETVPDEFQLKINLYIYSAVRTQEASFRILHLLTFVKSVYLALIFHCSATMRDRQEAISESPVFLKKRYFSYTRFPD